MIRTLSKLASFVLESDSAEASDDHLIAVFGDIEKHYWKIGDLFEQLKDKFPCLSEYYKQ